jgi:hypothetical protein
MVTPDPDMAQSGPQADPNATTGTGSHDPEETTSGSKAPTEPGGYNNPPENPQVQGQGTAPYTQAPGDPTDQPSAYVGDDSEPEHGPSTTDIPTDPNGVFEEAAPGTAVTPTDHADFEGGGDHYHDPYPSDAPATPTVDPEQGTGGSGGH